MPMHIPRPAATTGHHIRPSATTLSVLGACLTLAACGSSASSSHTSSSSAVAKSPATSPNSAQGPGSSQFAALQSCLRKQGITLPSVPTGANRPSGSAGPGAPGAGAGGFQLPKGISRSQYQAALKKCGGASFTPGSAGAFNSATARAALAKYASCLRQNGVNVPAPNTSGKGPVFDTKGIDTSSAAFKSAQSKCQSDIKGVIAGGTGGGTPPAGAGTGGPPNGAGAPTGEGKAASAPPAFKVSGG
jgi:hypothetical protein